MWSRKKKARIKELSKATDDAAAKLQAQRPQVNAVSSWLVNRKEQNGFGTEFEYTLRPRGAK